MKKVTSLASVVSYVDRVSFQVRVKQLPWPHGEDREAKTIILQFANGATYEYTPTEEQMDQTVTVKSQKYPPTIDTTIGYALSHGMIGEGVNALKALKIPYKKT